MIKVQHTSIKGRFNLVNEEIPGHDDDHYMRQLSREEVRKLRDSCNDVLEVVGVQ